MDKKYLNKLKDIDSSKIAISFSHELRATSIYKELHIKAIVSAYIIYIMQNDNLQSDIDAAIEGADIPVSMKELIYKYRNGCDSVIEKYINKFSSDDLLSFIIFNNNLRGESVDDTTPESVLNLVNRILDVKETDNVLELCSGKGNFAISEMMQCGHNPNYTGVELNYILNDIAKFRAYIVGVNCNYILSDARVYRMSDRTDKIFAAYPFNVRDDLLKSQSAFAQYEATWPKEILKRASSDWLFNLAIMEQLADDGRAVAIMTTGSTWNNRDKFLRKFFVEKGYIEAVINLPDNLLYGTAIPTSLFVFSKNNKSVKLINAKNLYIGERRKSILSDENIEQIIALLDNDEINAPKTLEELKKNDYILNAARYEQVGPEFKNGVEFGSVIKKITRGTQLRAKDLDEYKSDTPTNCRLLLLANINNGIINMDSEDQYLSEVPKKLEKYCVKNHSIVFSKFGMQAFKSAVAEIDDNMKLIASGNLFVIEVDEEKVNPFYIQAFFSSSVGELILKNTYTGGILPTMTLDGLKSLVIPLPSMEKQNLIANKYAALMDEVVLLEHRLEKTKAEMKNIHDWEE